MKVVKERRVCVAMRFTDVFFSSQADVQKNILSQEMKMTRREACGMAVKTGLCASLCMSLLKRMISRLLAVP